VPDLVVLLQRLIRARNENPPGDEAKVASIVADQLDALGADVRTFEPALGMRHTLERFDPDVDLALYGVPTSYGDDGARYFGVGLDNVVVASPGVVRRRAAYSARTKYRVAPVDSWYPGEVAAAAAWPQRRALRSIRWSLHLSTWAERGTGRTPQVATVCTVTGMSPIQEALRVPVAAVGYGRIDVCHSPDEPNFDRRGGFRDGRLAETLAKLPEWARERGGGEVTQRWT
jgi:hypothetical protein